MPFPLVTKFETAGTYEQWMWSNSAHITYAWHALLLRYSYLHTYINLYVIARVGVKLGINFASVRLSGNIIARLEAECYFSTNTSEICPGYFMTNLAIKN